MIITAKFASVCPCCSQRIAVGSKVEWAKGSPAKHEACARTANGGAAPSTPSRRSYPRRQDCRRYGWDGVRGSSSYYTSGQYDEES